MSEKIPTPQSEEVDLGKLFQVIGNGFKKIFNAIGDLLKGILHYGILLLIFFKKYALIIGVATILGGILGYILNRNDAKVYESNMILETNFGSGHQLYSQQQYLNNLIVSKDTKTLSDIFNISNDEAGSLAGFIIQPYDKENNLLLEYDYYMQHTDTIYTQKFTVLDMGRRLQDADYRKQKITAYALKQNIFSKLNNGIIRVIENDHYKKILKLNTDRLLINKRILSKDLSQVDSIRKRYQTVALLNAKRNVSGGTNINLADKQAKTNKDIDLFNQSRNLLTRLEEADAEQLRNGFITSIISEFSLGQAENRFYKQAWFKFSALGFLLSLMAILGLKLNTYLNNYQK